MGTENEIKPGDIVCAGWSADNYLTVNPILGEISLNTQSCNSDEYNVSRQSLDFATVIPRSPSLPAGSNTLFFTNLRSHKLKCRLSDGREKSFYLISEIKDIRVFDNAVVIDFYDGTSEKAATRGDDEFSIEQGITICLIKKLLSEKTYGHGHEAYNKLVNHAVKFYKKKCTQEKKQKAEEEAEEKRIERKIAKLKAKKEKRLAARQAAKREEEIEIQKEAYLRAMREFAKEKN